jgi:ATP-dependent DNA helicase RecG
VSAGNSLADLAGVDVTAVPRIADGIASKLKKAGIETVADLVLHVPRRYIDRTLQAPIAELPLGEEVTVIGTLQDVSDAKRVRKKLSIVNATLYDGSGVLALTWFNQPWQARDLSAGMEVAVSGKLARKKGRLEMTAPVVEVLDESSELLVTGRIVPVHPMASGVKPVTLRRHIRAALRKAQPMPDPLPADLVERLKLETRDSAIGNIHFPETMEDSERARERLVFDELFRLEVALAAQKHRQVDEAVGIAHEVGAGLVDAFIDGLPYELTGAQQRSIEEIQRDMASEHPMHRLLQGEVGSGKTVVAMAALLTAVQGGYQGAVMAPTEVLAEQHHLGLTPLAEEVGVRMALLTSSVDDREEVLAAAARGTVDIVVGTHALIQEGVSFARLGLAVVDEQHRFGVHQRVHLRDAGDGPVPDLLIMTATPIPRTLSMTLYGDLDVSVLDEMPKGRIPVETHHLGRGELSRVYGLIRSEVAEGRQAFVVCPLVEDSPKLQAASATAEFERLQKVFPDLRLGLLHGQMRSAEKEDVMARMRAGEIDVLVATTVIEVGIDISNATVMVVEDADRFGLSQLHQLRGRVGRGEHASTCVLVAEPTTEDGEQRLAAMVATTDGFRLAEEDLRIRGQGTVFGAKQAGMADLKLADILRDQETLITARREAFALVAADPNLDAHRAIRDEVTALLGESVEWLFKS